MAFSVVQLNAEHKLKNINFEHKSMFCCFVLTTFHCQRFFTILHPHMVKLLHKRKKVFLAINEHRINVRSYSLHECKCKALSINNHKNNALKLCSARNCSCPKYAHSYHNYDCHFCHRYEWYEQHTPNKFVYPFNSFCLCTVCSFVIAFN